MKTRNYSLLVVALVLVAGMGSVMAQGKLGPTTRISKVVPVETASVNAIVVNTGIVGFDDAKGETTFGYSFLGRTTGAYPGSLNLSVNITPAVPRPDQQSSVTGGSWTLPVYMMEARGTGYQGSLYGSLTKGTFVYDKDGTSANVYLLLNIDGGTQLWKGISGYATFTGTLVFDAKSNQTWLNGNLVFSTLTAPK